MNKTKIAPALLLNLRQAVSVFFVLSLCLSSACASNSQVKIDLGHQSAPRLVQLPPVAIASLPEICRNAWDDNGNHLIDEGCDELQSALNIAIYWSEPEVDFDLFVSGPDQQVAKINRVTSIGIYKTADCPERGPELGSFESCSVNLESVKLEGLSLAPGDYQVQVVLEKMGAELNTELALSLGVVSPGASNNYQIFFTREHQRFEMILHVPPRQ